MFHFLQMTIIESASLHLLIEKLHRENCFIPSDIISRLAALNKFLANEQNITMDHDCIRFTRTEMKKIYEQFFSYFSVAIRGKRIELERRGRTESSVLLNENSISNIYAELQQQIMVNEKVLSRIAMFGDENKDMLSRYHEIISSRLSNLYKVVFGFHKVNIQTDEWGASEITSYLNWEDAVFIKQLIEIFVELDIDMNKVSDFAQAYDDILQSSQAKKQSLFARLYEEMMLVFVSEFKDILQEKKTYISVLLSELHYAKDRFKDVDRQAALDIPREDFSTTIWSEMTSLSSFLKMSFKGLSLLLSPSFACELSIAQRTAHEDLATLTRLDDSSVKPILDRYRSYRCNILDLFQNGILNDKLLSDEDHQLVANKIAEFLELLSPLQRVSVGFFANHSATGLGPKNEKCYERISLKSPTPSRKINNGFFLGEVKAKEDVDEVLNSSIPTPINNTGK